MSGETAELRERLRRIPKAELHLHLEGTVGPDVLWRLAQRHRCSLGIRDEASCRALYEFSGFDGFIQLYKAISVHLAEPADYAEAVAAMAGRLAQQGVVYAEVFISIGILLWKKVDVADFFSAAEQARQQAERDLGIEIAWIADAVRQFGPEHLDDVLSAVEKLQAGSIVAVGIGGDERIAPSAWFVDGYNRARAMGLHTTVHAGETRGAESIWEAVRLLRPERIGHGLHAFEDPELVEALAREKIWLDVCPSSNVKTGCWPVHRPHPIRQYYNGGINLSLSSDDPGIFGADLLDEYAFLHRHLGFGWTELQRLMANSFVASFLPEARKRQWLVSESARD